jgi:trigger factor
MTQRELAMIAQMTGQSLDDPQMQERLRVDAEVKVRAGLLMAEIAKDKEIKVTDEDLEKGYEELAQQSGKNVAKIKAEYREKQKRDMLVGMILEDKVLDLIEGAAKITEAES